jgi:hypothetical protein
LSNISHSPSKRTEHGVIDPAFEIAHDNQSQVIKIGAGLMQSDVFCDREVLAIAGFRSEGGKR